MVEDERPVTSLEALHAALAADGVLRPDARFMHLELDITTHCNLRCTMCYHSLDEFVGKKPLHLAPDDFAAVADRILPHAHSLSLSLGNEPLTSPHFIPILRIAARYGVPHINFFTHGLLLREAIIDAIVECGVAQVVVSVDGATARTYERIRRGGKFDRLVRNVRMLIERRTAAGKTLPRIRFDMVMMRSNVHEMPDLVRLAKQLGVDEVNFTHMVSYEGLDMQHESLVHDKAGSNSWLRIALRVAATEGVRIAAHPALFNLDEPADAPARAADGPAAAAFAARPYCLYPFFHVSMNAGGHVLACPYSHGEAPFGRVSPETPIDQIWLGPAFTTLRRRILEHDPPDMCRRCSFLALRHPDVEVLFVQRKN